MTDNENILNDSDRSTYSELIQTISDDIGRDIRRYPCRFNTDND